MAPPWLGLDGGGDGDGRNGGDGDAGEGGEDAAGGLWPVVSRSMFCDGGKTSICSREADLIS